MNIRGYRPYPGERVLTVLLHTRHGEVERDLIVDEQDYRAVTEIIESDVAHEREVTDLRMGDVYRVMAVARNGLGPLEAEKVEEVAS